MHPVGLLPRPGLRLEKVSEMVAAGALSWLVMSTVHLPDELVERFAAEAARRGVSVDELAAGALAARFPVSVSDESGADALEAFIGCGASGRREPFDIHQARAELAAGKTAEEL